MNDCSLLYPEIFLLPSNVMRIISYETEANSHIPGFSPFVDTGKRVAGGVKTPQSTTLSESQVNALVNRLSKYLSEHGVLNITVPASTEALVPGVVMQSILAEKSIETQLEISLNTPMLKDSVPHILLGFDKNRPEVSAITFRLRGEAFVVRPEHSLPLNVSRVIEGISIMGDVHRAFLLSSSIIAQELFKTPKKLEDFNRTAGYGVEIVDKFLAFFATQGYGMADSLYSTSVPFLPELTGGDVAYVREFLEKIEIDPDMSILELRAEPGKRLVEEVLKKVNSLSKKIVASNTMVSFLALYHVDGVKIDLREMAAALRILAEVSPGSLFESLTRSTIRPVLGEYYYALKKTSEYIEEIVRNRSLLFKGRLVVIEDQGLPPEEVPLSYVSSVLEFLGLIEKDHVLAIESEGVWVTSKFELWRRGYIPSQARITPLDSVRVGLSPTGEYS